MNGTGGERTVEAVSPTEAIPPVDFEASSTGRADGTAEASSADGTTEDASAGEPFGEAIEVMNDGI